MRDDVRDMAAIIVAFILFSYIGYGFKDKNVPLWIIAIFFIAFYAFLYIALWGVHRWK